MIDPSYALRIAGLAYATAMLSVFWLWATVMLLGHERLSLPAVRKQLRFTIGRDPVIRRVFAHGIREYARRDFHPRDTANEHLAREWFAAHDLPFTEAA